MSMTVLDRSDAYTRSTMVKHVIQKMSSGEVSLNIHLKDPVPVHFISFVWSSFKAPLR